MKQIIQYLMILIILLGCGKNQIENNIILSGITTANKYYTPDSFFNKDTILKTFYNNKMDFWFFLEPEKLNEEEHKISRKLNNISKKLSEKKIILFQKMQFFSSSINLEPESNSVFFYTPDKKSDPLPVQVREILPSILFNTIQIDYQGGVVSHYDDYINYLNRGFILGVSAESEILGPEWNINSTARMNVITPGLKQEEVNDALVKRRTYISFEPETKIDFRINHYEIGDVIESDENVFNFSINVKSGNSNIGSISLVTNNNKIIKTFSNINSKSFSNKNAFELKDKFNYLMLKIYFENGNTAYTTPIWVLKSKDVVVYNPKLNIKETKKKVNKFISVDVENISHKNIDNIGIRLFDDKDTLLKSKSFTLGGRETKKVNIPLELDNTTDLNVFIKSYIDNQYICESQLAVKPAKVRRILIDKYHDNLFTDNLNIFESKLKEKDYTVTFADDYSFFVDDNLKNYDLLVVVSPTAINESASEEIQLLYALHSFVYNGGSILLGGANDEKAKFSVAYLNRILRILYSPVKYRFDDRVGIYPIFDGINYFSNKYTPIFNKFNSSVIKSESIKQIYLRSPLEIMAVTSAGESPIAYTYNTLPIAIFNETTEIENRTVYKTSNLSPVVINKFGKGQICIMSGINFGDFDINNLDNKQWILEIIDYLTSGK